MLPGLNEVRNVIFPAERKLWSLGMKSLIIPRGWLHLCISYPVYDTVIPCLCLVSRASLILVSGSCQTLPDSPVHTLYGYAYLMSAWLGSAIKQRLHKVEGVFASRESWRCQGIDFHIFQLGNRYSYFPISRVPPPHGMIHTFCFLKTSGPEMLALVIYSFFLWKDNFLKIWVHEFCFVK